MLWIESPAMEDREEHDYPRFLLLKFPGMGDGEADTWWVSIVESLIGGEGEELMVADDPIDVQESIEQELP